MRIFVPVLAGLVLAAGCGKTESPAERRGKRIEARVMQGDGARLLKAPAFRFRERSGRTVGLEDLKGKVWLATFLFTRCQTQCLTICSVLRKLQDEFVQAPDFTLVSTTVDPEYDTPEVLKEFAARQGAHPQRWLFLTGSREDIRRFAYDGLKLSWDRAQPLQHTVRAVLIDREGWIRGWFELSDRARVEQLRRMIRKLLAEKDAA